MRTVRYNYRLRPGRTASRRLRLEWDLSRWLWNRCVEADRAGLSANATTMSSMLTKWRGEFDWLAAGSSVVQQQTIRTWWSAQQASLGVAGRKPPRFKSRKRSLPSTQYTKRGFSIREGRLRVAGGFDIPVVWSRDLPSDPTSVRVFRDAAGHWYASFVVRIADETLPARDDALGIDWGVKTIATTTDPVFDLAHGDGTRRSATRLARYQRMMARRAPKRGHRGSSGYHRAKRSAAKTHIKTARQRQDRARKWARRVAEHHGRIAVEDFKPKFLAKSTMAKKAADAAIGATKRALIEYADRFGRALTLVPPAFTTMTCSSCRARAKQRLDLSMRTFRCEECGYTADRDRNAARVILATAGYDRTGVDGVRHGRACVVCAS